MTADADVSTQLVEVFSAYERERSRAEVTLDVRQALLAMDRRYTARTTLQTSRSVMLAAAARRNAASFRQKSGSCLVTMIKVTT